MRAIVTFCKREGILSGIITLQIICMGFAPISKKGGSVSERFTVRKKSGSVGVSRVFAVNSPEIDKITVVKKGMVRRAKLNFLKGMKKEYKVKERN